MSKTKKSKARKKASKKRHLYLERKRELETNLRQKNFNKYREKYVKELEYVEVNDLESDTPELTYYRNKLKQYADKQKLLNLLGVDEKTSEEAKAKSKQSYEDESTKKFLDLFTEREKYEIIKEELNKRKNAKRKK